MPTVLAAGVVGVFLFVLVDNFFDQIDCEFRFLQSNKPRCSTELLQPAVGLAVSAVAFVFVFRFCRKPFAAGSWEDREAFDGALVCATFATMGIVTLGGYFLTQADAEQAIPAFAGLFLLLLAVPAGVYSRRRLNEKATGDIESEVP